MAVDCGALPPNLMESELFGYKRGAFTGANRDHKGLFAQADGGTLFLDEITNLSNGMQVKLLRVLQEGEIRPLGSDRLHKVDVRIISAASSDLEAKVQSGEFRADLYYRINIVPVRLPALRERAGDIPLLASHFLQRFAEIHHKKVSQIDAAAMRILEAYSWPGNIRELENVIERAVILADRNDKMLRRTHLPFELSFKDSRFPVKEIPTSGDLKTLIENYECQILAKVLKSNNGNKSAAARSLNISERVMRYKIKRFNVR